MGNAAIGNVLLISPSLQKPSHPVVATKNNGFMIGSA